MLTLADSFQIDSFTLFRDYVYREGRGGFGSRFYALPSSPRLARDGAGRPAFDFVWYRRPAGAAGPAAEAGGLVTLTAELAPTTAERHVLASAIGEHLGAAAPPTVEVLSVPFTGGTVELAYAGEGAPGELATGIAGRGPATLTGGERTTFAVELSAEGAALLWQALERGTEVFHLRFDLICEHRLGDVELRAWCDAERAHRVLTERLALGSVSRPEVRELLVSRRLAGMEIVTEQALPAERVAALEALGAGLLEAALASAFFAASPGEGTQTTLCPYAPGLSAQLNHTFAQSFPLEHHLVVQGLLGLGIPVAALGERVRRVDLSHGFSEVMEVKVYAAVDFADGVIPAVKATLEYDETSPSGERVSSRGELIFRSGDTVGTFRTDLAAPHLRRFHYTVDVYYDGSPEPARLAFPPVETSALVLDLDAFGVLAVDVSLRDVPFDDVRKVIVDLEYPTRSLSRRLILDGEHSVGAWREVVREQPGPYRYRVAWITAAGARLETDWREATSRRLALDAPPELRRLASRVELVSAGDFGGLAQIVAEIESLTGDSSPTQLVFQAAGERQTWTAPTAAPHYRVRQTLVLADGDLVPLGWVESDRGVFIVRDPLRRSVQVVGRLLDLGGAWKLALVALEPGSGAAARTTLVLRDGQAAPLWSFRAAEESGAFRYQLTLIRSTGERVETPWQEGRGEILVLRPPVEA